MRLKYTRKHCKGIWRSNAARYLVNNKPPRPFIFRYFYDLHIFFPWQWFNAEDLARMRNRCRGTAIKDLRKLQNEYNLPHINYVTVKDYCNYYQVSMTAIQKYFFSAEWMAFQKRFNKLK